jgi:tetratricopeptide (TPR) repeat protein
MTPPLQFGASRRTRGGLVVSLALLGLTLPSLVYAAGEAADEAKVLRARAAKLATAGDCAAALPLIEQARGIDPAGDGAAALMTGRCLISQEKFAEARPVLERAVAHDPNSGEALLALGVAKYHLGDKDAARADLERAQTMLPNNPETELYLGMILLEEEKPAAAVTRLDRSRGLYGDTFEPVSNYYGALAQAETGDEQRAEESLRRVQLMAPGTIWAQRAGEALAQAEARRLAKVAGATRWVTLQAGLDYDSNISLRSDQISRPDDVTDDDDGRGWWGVDAGAELFRKNGWGGGVGGAYTGSHPFKADDFDQHFISSSFWLDRELGNRTLLRISPEGGFAFFDGDEFLRFVGVRPELRHDFGDAGLGTLYVRYAYNDFRYEEFSNDVTLRNRRDRDGHDVLFGYDHQIMVGDSTMLRGGLFGRDFTAVGSDYDFTGGGGWLGLRQTLPWRLILDVTGSAEYDNYESRSSFADTGEGGSRRDVVGAAGAVLTKPINEWLSVSARYQYLNNDSNTQLFNYDRHIAGAFVTIGLIR